MKELFEQVIQRREYNLKSLLTCIDQYHIEGKLTDDERQERVAGLPPWGLDGLMIALIIFMILDYITGMCAVIDKKLSSAVGFRGICKKVLILMLVGVANVVHRIKYGSRSMTGKIGN